MADDAIQREFADDQGVGHIGPELSSGKEDADTDRQVVGGSGFLEIGGSEIDRNPAMRELASRVANRRADPFAAFLDRGVRQADQDHAWLPAITYIDFDLDQHSVESDNRATEDLCQHLCASSPPPQHRVESAFPHFWVVSRFEGSRSGVAGRVRCVARAKHCTITGYEQAGISLDPVPLYDIGMDQDTWISGMYQFRLRGGAG